MDMINCKGVSVTHFFKHPGKTQSQADSSGETAGQ